ncbi:ACT domain-containing protein [Neglectibacter caecimuris]|uniref:ACT domain-containing protein n=1 Tax=Neglectibacter caecimuris TaxID=3093658 RepID=UPI002AC8DC9D|nr:ACT domain-containing protein [Neglectibacter sp. M00184]
MKKDSYLVVNSSVLPEIYQKVVQANALLESGEAASTSEAVRMAGISRSVYYKYRGSVFPYTKQNPAGILTVQAMLTDRTGVLVSLLTVFYRAGANILTVNQNIPVMGRAFVSVSARIAHMEISADELLENLKQVDGVIKIESIMDR